MDVKGREELVGYQWHAAGFWCTLCVSTAVIDSSRTATVPLIDRLTVEAMRRLSRTQGKANQPEAPTRVAVAASKSSKRVTKATDSRKSITGAEPADAFSDALQRHEPKRPATASSTARRGSRVAVGAPSPPKAEKDTKEGEAKTASRLAPTDKDERERGAGGDGDGEESGEQSEEEEDGDASGFYGVFVQTKRCETLCRDLGITTRDIRRMKRKYDANDMYNTYVLLLVGKWFTACC
jgi:hypothetical protein